MNNTYEYLYVPCGYSSALVQAVTIERLLILAEKFAWKYYTEDSA